MSAVPPVRTLKAGTSIKSIKCSQETLKGKWLISIMIYDQILFLRYSISDVDMFFSLEQLCSILERFPFLGKLSHDSLGHIVRPLLNFYANRIKNGCWKKTENKLILKISQKIRTSEYFGVS